jgi:hypothetical protein
VSTVVSRYRRTEFVHLFNESGACLKKSAALGATTAFKAAAILGRFFAPR